MFPHRRSTNTAEVNGDRNAGFMGLRIGFYVLLAGSYGEGGLGDEGVSCKCYSGDFFGRRRSGRLPVLVNVREEG